MEHIIELPLTAEKVANLRAGDTVKLSGIIYTARDAALLNLRTPQIHGTGKFLERVMRKGRKHPS